MTNVVNDADFYELVCQRLSSLSYTVTDSDEWIIKYIIDKTLSNIQTVCNVAAVPAALKSTACEMVCGEFLNQLLGANKLDALQIEQAVQSISMGDTSMTFASGTDSVTALKTLLATMMNKDGELICFRRLKW